MAKDSRALATLDAFCVAEGLAGRVRHGRRSDHDDPSSGASPDVLAAGDVGARGGRVHANARILADVLGMLDD